MWSKTSMYIPLTFIFLMASNSSNWYVFYRLKSILIIKKLIQYHRSSVGEFLSQHHAVRYFCHDFVQKKGITLSTNMSIKYRQVLLLENKCVSDTFHTIKSFVTMKKNYCTERLKRRHNWETRFEPKLGQIGHKWEKSRAFSYQM